MFLTPQDFKMAFYIGASENTNNYMMNWDSTNFAFKFLVYKSAFNLAAQNLTPEELKDFYCNQY